MKPRNLFFIGIGAILLLTGCEKKITSNKVIDAVPVDVTTTSLPGLAAQQVVLLKRDALAIVVPIINRSSLAGASYPELTGPDAQSRYTFSFNQHHYGHADFVIQFFDETGNVIDPLANPTSTSTFKATSIKTTGGSSEFSYSEDLVLTLTIAGDVDSDKWLTGTSNFNGSGYAIVYTFASPGIRSNFEGAVQGNFTGAGTGGPNNEATSLGLVYSSDHSTDGTITWEGMDGGIHFENGGRGFVVTNQVRILLP